MISHFNSPVFFSVFNSLHNYYKTLPYSGSLLPYSGSLLHSEGSSSKTGIPNFVTTLSTYHNWTERKLLTDGKTCKFFNWPSALPRCRNWGSGRNLLKVLCCCVFNRGGRLSVVNSNCFENNVNQIRDKTYHTVLSLLFFLLCRKVFNWLCCSLKCR